MWSSTQHLLARTLPLGDTSLSLPLLALLLAAAVAAAVVGVHCAQQRLASRSGKQSAMPRPEGTLPLVYNTFQAIKHGHRWHDWMVEQCERFDGGRQAFLVRLLGARETVTLSSPEVLEDVLKTHFGAFEKGPQLHEFARDLLGDGIFGVDGHKWMRQRKTASNLFSLRALRESMTASIQKHALVLNGIFARATAAKQPVDLFELLNRFTMETFAEIGFGVELGALDSTEEHPFQVAFDRAQRILKLRFMRPGWFWKAQRVLDVGAEKELRQCIKTIDDTVLGIIGKALEHRKTQSREDMTTGRHDIVSLFLDNVSHDESGTSGGAADTTAATTNAAFDPVFLRDIVVNFLIAGRDTTAQALSWFFYLLSEHPHVEAKIRAELAAKLPQLLAGAIATPSMEQTSELVYLEAALRETLRLYPSVPGLSKFANRDITLSDGTFVRKGQSVSISAYVLARMTHVWGDDAKQFRPERWIDAASGKIVQVSAFKFPAFNAGPRLCLGMNLAMTEMKITASMVLSKFHLALVPGQHVTYDLSLTLPIKGKLLMAVEPAVTA